MISNWHYKKHSIRGLYLLLLAFTLLFTHCTKDESWKEDLIGTAEVNVDSEALGCNDATYPDWQSSDYFLPYPIGEAYMIGLGPCGGSYHSQGLPDQFAIDFNMPIGHTILSARSGRVIYVEERGADGTTMNNFVTIQHDDGTFAMYMHLTQDGAAVEVGQTVPRGGLIGYSGNTGFAGYPHLHFVVVTEERWTFPYTSIPVTFKNTIPNEKSLEEGVHYPAYPK